MSGGPASPERPLATDCCKPDVNAAEETKRGIAEVLDVLATVKQATNEAGKTVYVGWEADTLRELIADALEAAEAERAKLARLLRTTRIPTDEVVPPPLARNPRSFCSRCFLCGRAKGAGVSNRVNVGLIASEIHDLRLALRGQFNFTYGPDLRRAEALFEKLSSAADAARARDDAERIEQRISAATN